MYHAVWCLVRLCEANYYFSHTHMFSWTQPWRHRHSLAVTFTVLVRGDLPVDLLHLFWPTHWVTCEVESEILILQLNILP